MMPVWEVSETGRIIEHYIMTEEQIHDAVIEGRIMVSRPWGPGFWDPIFDFSSGTWVEGNPDALLNSARQHKRDEMKMYCDSTILSTRFKANVHGAVYEFSYDEQAQSRFNGVGLLFQKGMISQMEWTAYLNGERTRIMLSSSDFDIVSLSAMMHCDNNVVKYNKLLQDIEQANDLDSINAISWGV